MLGLTCCIIELLFFPSHLLSSTSNKLLRTVCWNKMIPKWSASIMSRSLSNARQDVCRHPSEMIQVLHDTLQRWQNGSVQHTQVPLLGFRDAERQINFFFSFLFLRELVPVSCLSLLTMHHLWRHRFHVSQKSGLDRAEILLILMILSLGDCNQVSGDHFYRW